MTASLDRQIVLAARPNGIPQLSDFRVETEIPRPASGQLSARGAIADLDGARDDGFRRWPACPRRKCREVYARRLHQAAKDIDERLLRQPARHEHAVAARRRL